MSKYLTRDQVLSAHGFQTKEIDAPELDGILLVRELTAPEMTRLGFHMSRRDENDKLTADMSQLGDLFPDIVAWCVVDEDNRQVFTRQDIDQFPARYFSLIQRIVIAVFHLSKLTPDGDENEEKKEPPAKK